MKRKIGIFRGLDVRIPQAEFAASFSKLHPFFGANLNDDLRKYLSASAIDYKDIPLRPAFFADPVFPFLKKTDFTPWLEFDRHILATHMAKLDIVEVYEPYFFYSSQVADFAKKRKIPLVTEIWTSFGGHPSKYIPPYNHVVKNVIEKTDLFVLRSERAHRFLESFQIPARKKVTVYHGVNTVRFSPGNSKHSVVRILFVGALATHKGLDDLLAVFEQLSLSYPNKLELVICGDGPLREKVISMSTCLPIRYVGQISNLALADIYKEADIYCQPSKDYYLFGIKGGEEFAGYTFMEALASGLPIVSSYCGGIPEIVGNDNFLTEQGNKEALYKTLNKLITNPSLRDEIGKKNRQRALSFFDLSTQTQKLEKLILEKLS